LYFSGTANILGDSSTRITLNLAQLIYETVAYLNRIAIHISQHSSRSKTVERHHI